MSDQFDVDVHDAQALEEIEMLANLIVATSEHDGRVPQDRIDEILGVAPPSDDDGAPAEGSGSTPQAAWADPGTPAD